MMMSVFSIMVSLLFMVAFYFWTLNLAFFVSFSRNWAMKSFISDLTTSLFLTFTSPISLYFITSLFIFLGVINLFGNIPLMNIPTMYYFFTLSISMSLWISIMVVISYTQLREFLAHMLPFGAPSALMLFLPLVEVFSHLIRPFTLMIRLSTNLSSGHIMMFMFSFFSVFSNVLTFIITVVLFLLLVLEVCISILQAYIFSSLISMYLSESY